VAALLRGRQRRPSLSRRNHGKVGSRDSAHDEYARDGDVNIAYQVIGDGPPDLLFIPAFLSHLDLYWPAPETAAFFRRLAAFLAPDSCLTSAVPARPTPPPALPRCSTCHLTDPASRLWARAGCSLP
jgi:hypothetical protein